MKYLTVYFLIIGLFNRPGCTPIQDFGHVFSAGMQFSLVTMFPRG